MFKFRKLMMKIHRKFFARKAWFLHRNGVQAIRIHKVSGELVSWYDDKEFNGLNASGKDSIYYSEVKALTELAKRLKEEKEFWSREWQKERQINKEWRD